jgi:hypothetical protein
MERRERERSESGRRPWEGYRASDDKQVEDYGSAGGQYSTPNGPDQNPYNDEEEFRRSSGEQYSRSWEQERAPRDRGGRDQGRGRERGQNQQWSDRGQGAGGYTARGQYGQVGAEREESRDLGGYSRSGQYNEGGSQRRSGQGGFGQDMDESGGYGAAGYAGYGSPAQDQSSGQQHDPEYAQWRRDQSRKYDDDYKSWRDAQLKSHDDDYANWRKERHEQFGQSFSEWRQKRETTEAGGQAKDEQSGQSSAKQSPSSGSPVLRAEKSQG